MESIVGALSHDLYRIPRFIAQGFRGFRPHDDFPFSANIPPARQNRFLKQKQVFLNTRISRDRRNRFIVAVVTEKHTERYALSDRFHFFFKHIVILDRRNDLIRVFEIIHHGIEP